MLSKTHETEFNRNKSLTSGETMSNKFNIFMNKYFYDFQFFVVSRISVVSKLAKFWWGQKARFFPQI